MPLRKAWIDGVRLGLRVGLTIAVVLLGMHYLERWSRPPLEKQKPSRIQRVDDFYVNPPKSYVSNIASAQKLIGKPLWVKEGYRRRTEPDGRPLEPIEKIVPTVIVARGDEGVLQFEHAGKTERIGIGPPNRLFIDEMFFIKDPREIYDHWPPETWEKVEKHQIEEGMTEFQVTFALGAGQTLRSSQYGETRVVAFTLGKDAGLQPVRVTFRQGQAEEIVPLDK